MLLDLFTNSFLSMSTFILIYVRRWECTTFKASPAWSCVCTSHGIACIMLNFTAHGMWSAAWNQSNYVTTATLCKRRHILWIISAHRFSWEILRRSLATSIDEQLLPCTKNYAERWNAKFKLSALKTFLMICPKINLCARAESCLRIFYEAELNESFPGG